MQEQSLTSQAVTMINAVIFRMEEAQLISINPAVVSAEVDKQLGEAEPVRRHLSILQLRQLTRESLRKRIHWAEKNHAELQEDAFDGLLQPYYPVNPKDKDTIYKRRQSLTVEEGMKNCNDMRKKAKGLSRHADELEAYVIEHNRPTG